MNLTENPLRKTGLCDLAPGLPLPSDISFLISSNSDASGSGGTVAEWTPSDPRVGMNCGGKVASLLTQALSVPFWVMARVVLTDVWFGACCVLCG